jgi:taurine dioxygenase
VTEDGKPVGDHGDGELNWHTDQGFVERPSGYTFLLAREVPPTGGNTSFANMYRAYERLDDVVQKKIARLQIKHQESHTAQGIPRPGYRDIATSDPRELPGPQHPDSARILGRNAGALPRPRFGAYIPGLPLAESEDAARPPVVERCGVECGRRNGGVGDLIVWDNRCTMHRRDAFVGLGRRRMHRLTPWASGRSDGERAVAARRTAAPARALPCHASWRTLSTNSSSASSHAENFRRDASCRRRALSTRFGVSRP